MKVKDLDGEFIYVSTSQEVDAIKMSIGKSVKTDHCDAFFCKLGDGDFELVYGLEGIIPSLSKEVYQVYPQQK